MLVSLLLKFTSLIFSALMFVEDSLDKEISSWMVVPLAAAKNKPVEVSKLNVRLKLVLL